jgi:protein TonB
VPVPVPDAAALPVEPGPVGAPGAGPDVNAGGVAGVAGEGVAPAPDPLPGAFVYADQLPERVLFVAPEYSDMAREAGVEGTVMLWALVDLDGSVKAVQVIRSVPLLDAAASAAVHRWRFTPALASGHPVRVWVAVPVRFSLH